MLKTKSKIHVAILGSTGSIGTQALQVIDNNQSIFQVEILTANNNTDLLISQAKKFLPNAVGISNENKYQIVKNALANFEIKVYAGKEALAQIVEFSSIDIVLTALVGYAGLIPTMNAIKAKKNIALANKETLVVAGDLIMNAAKQNNVNILPVDSEHSAIFQCLQGERLNTIEKIYLTASGGPFRGKTKQELTQITKKQALNHPNWSMGNKVTIDSASLMNKGLEAIEAKWLFDLKPEQIDIIVHPQSIIHSIVQFNDGSMKAQMGIPDMKLPIQYALAYPNRIYSDFKRFNFLQYPQFTFEKPDMNVFQNLKIALNALEVGGNIPCIMNAANEIVVEAFLKAQIKFHQMPEIIDNVIKKFQFKNNLSLNDYIQLDKETRRITKLIINN